MSTEEQYIAEMQADLTEKFPNRDFSVGTADYSIFIQPWARSLALRDAEDVDEILANMSIIQVLNNPDASEELTAQILSNFNVTQRTGSNATGFLSIVFSGTTVLNIPSTSSFQCAGLTFQPVKDFVGIVGEVREQDTSEITYTEAISIGNNEYVFAIQVESVEVTDTVIGPGIACTTDLSSPFIVSINTASTFTGGVLPETTAELLERASLGITAPAASGSDHIRSMLESSPYNVLDSAVFGLGSEIVTRDKNILSGISTGGHSDAYILTSPAIQRVQAPLEATRIGSSNNWSMPVPEDVYPGAYAVTSVSFGGTVTNASLLHKLGYTPSGNRPKINNAEDARYSAYQTLTIEFEDATGDASDTERAYMAEVLYMPNVGLVQEYVEDIERRASSFDILVKAIIPIEVSASVSITYPAGVNAPDASVIQASIANAINGIRSGLSRLHTSVIVAAAQAAFPEGTVQMPIRIGGKIYLPSGEVGHSSSTDYLSVPQNSRVSPESVKYFANTADIYVALSEGAL